MGKKTSTAKQVESDVAELEPVGVDAGGQDKSADESGFVGPKRFNVHLAAHTPIEFNSVTIEAENAAEAKAKFCEMNGIVDSACPWNITEV